MILSATLFAAALLVQEPALGWDDAALCSVAVRLAAAGQDAERADALRALAGRYEREARRLGEAQDKNTAMQIAIYEGAFASPEYQDQAKAAAQACETRGRELFPAS